MSYNRLVRTLGLLLAGLALAALGAARGAERILLHERDIPWKPGPPSIPCASRTALLEGDPKAPALFTLRVRLPAGCELPPHWHPADERLTVLSGDYAVGIGDRLERKTATRLAPGAFSLMPAGTRHYAFTEKGALLQITALGPWGATYLKGLDDRAP